MAAVLLAVALGVGAPARAALPAAASRDVSGTAHAAGQQVAVVVELLEPPVANVYAAAREEGAVSAAALTQLAQEQLASVEAAQQRLLASLAGLDEAVIYRVQRVYNGVAVRIAAGQLPALERLPGVKAVHPLVAKRPANARSVPHIGAPTVWEGGAWPAATGRGVRIGIIDTGVDYFHVDFGGPGTGYNTNDSTRIGDVPGFPGFKVRGGYDFAGDAYNADASSSGYNPSPAPDPDPMDCYGHGTHVAGTAAGTGVTEAGLTYSGPYSSSLDFADFRIGPGVAPQAEIYALKVFGCAGSSEIVDQAIEWSVDPNGDGDFSDRMHVINLSLGSTAGAFDDPTAVAAENAALTGMIVVASAGNDGDVFFAVGSPGVATRAVSVGASAIASENDQIASFSARGPRRGDLALKPDITAPGMGIVSAAERTGAGERSSSGTSMATPHVAGAFALLRQIYPDPEIIGVELAAGPQTAPDRAIWTSEELKALLINTAWPAIHAGGVMTAPIYSPSRVGAGLLDLRNVLDTPVVAYSAGNPGAVSVSFGAPEVLDVWSETANVRLANKSLSPITVTVAYTPVNDMPGVEVTLPASGVLSVPARGYATLPVTLQADVTAMQRVPDPTLARSPTTPRQWLSEEMGLLVFTLDDDPAALTLPLYAAPRPVAHMRADSDPLDFGSAISADRSLALVGQGLPGTDTPTTTVSLFSAFELHYASKNTAPPDLPGPDLYDHADLKYVGVGVTAPPGDDPDVGTSAEAAGTLYFGLATHAAWSTPNEVEFGVYIDTYLDGVADYRVFNSSEEGFLGEGVIGDTMVSVVENLRTNRRTIAGYLNDHSAAELDTAIYDTNVMVLPVTAAALGLAGPIPAFAYRVDSYSLDVSNARPLGLVVDRTPWLTFNPSQPGLILAGDTGSPPLYADRPGASLAVTFNLAEYATARAKGLLIFHHHNLAGSGGTLRTQVVPITYRWPFTSFLPVVVQR